MKFLAFAIILTQFYLGYCRDCPKKVVACYYASWSAYRPIGGNFTINDIDPNLCTHLIYSFAGLDISSRIMSLDSQLDLGWGGYKAFTALKEQNPCLKTLLAIGGWNEGSRKYSIMTSLESYRKEFAESALKFLAAYDFDGLDIDWEYPTERGGIDEDRDNFIELLKYTRQRFDKWGLLLTIAVPLSVDYASKSYAMEKLNDLVDHVFLMAYDYTSVESPVTGLLAPMTPIKDAIDLWTSHIDSNKLVLGLPSYARTLNLKDKSKNGIGDATEGIGIQGPITGTPGFLAYYEVQYYLNTGRYTTVESDGTYYAYYYTVWLSFDLKDSFKNKVKYALRNNLGGVMVWSIDTDDFTGQHSDTTYPILKSIYEVLDAYN